MSNYQTADSDSWRDEADCAVATVLYPQLQGAWDSNTTADNDRAAEICETCPVRQLCLMDALRDPDSQGLRGGFLFSRGRVHFRDAAKIKKEFPALRHSRFRISHVSNEQREREMNG